MIKIIIVVGVTCTQMIFIGLPNHALPPSITEFILQFEYDITLLGHHLLLLQYLHFLHSVFIHLGFHLHVILRK